LNPFYALPKDTRAPGHRPVPRTRLWIAGAALSSALTLAAPSASAEDPAPAAVSPTDGSASTNASTDPERGARTAAPATGARAGTPPRLPERPPDWDQKQSLKLPEIEWRDEWPRFRTSEYVATAIFGAISFAALALPPEETRWRGINALDAAGRSALRLEGQANRDIARDASDLLLTVMTNQVLFDTFIVTWWWRGKASVAWQMGLINIEAIALNGAINGLIVAVASRERPYRAGCVGPEETQTRDCRGNKRYRSFFSGHTSTSFTSAGLMCAHHANLPLYGGGAAEAWAVCLGGFATAATVGLMRIMSDQHFVTDVLTGAAIGTAAGLGVPLLLHYRGGKSAEKGEGARPSKAGPISIRFAPTALGGYILGEF
jgi:membrane-associated phospholipid phosphatase